ncbi:unnamed protein product [Dibothriocephalus latus]|uniref:Uncharacterized protein n=1 Tax=Dibothriocephalus latus TaxID=60516 RepID=A0A3P7LTS1_DIBLA|nr:unnamed protein product [Dibothriocephalus latus]
MIRDYLTLIVLLSASVGLLRTAEGSKIPAADWSADVGSSKSQTQLCSLGRRLQIMKEIQFLSRYLDICSDSTLFDGKTRKRSPEPLWVVE